jgi:hypothetical protein
MKEDRCPVCQSVMSREGQTYYCYVCLDFVDNLLPDENDESVIVGSKDLAIDILKQAIRCLEERSFGNPLIDMKGFDCDAVNYATQAIDQVVRSASPAVFESEEPYIDDTVHCCPECERPNQFGELCESCR